MAQELSQRTYCWRRCGEFPEGALIRVGHGEEGLTFIPVVQGEVVED